MNLLEILAESGGKNREYDQFVSRYEPGDPSDGYSDQEVLDRYGSPAHKVSPTDYEQAAREAFGRLHQSSGASLLVTYNKLRK
jgi:hypothetical protein